MTWDRVGYRLPMVLTWDNVRPLRLSRHSLDRRVARAELQVPFEGAAR